MEGIDEKAEDVGEAIEESTADAETGDIVEPHKSVQKRGRSNFLTPRLDFASSRQANRSNGSSCVDSLRRCIELFRRRAGY